MKHKKTVYLLIAALMSGGILTSCSTLHGHWGIGGEFPDYGYSTTPPPPGHHKPPKPPKKKKEKKPKKDKKHHRSDW